MKFYHAYDDDGSQLHETMAMHLAHKFKYRIMWELRHLDERIIDDDGTIILTKDGRITYDGTDVVLAAEIGHIISGIDFSKW